MIVQALAFYLFAAVTIGSAVLVITVRNPVHAVLFLILAFFSSAGLFVLLGAEFVAMIMVIVYVGAVAVLFLFVVMMLDIDFGELRQGLRKHLPVGLVVGIILLVELIALALAWRIQPEADAVARAAAPAPEQVENTRALGQLIYTDYILLFQVSGLILLIAMIGAIVLTLRQRAGVRRQAVGDQVSRERDKVMAIRKPGIGEGI